VDDITLVSKHKAALAKAVEDLSKVFKLRDLDPTSWLLGIHIERDWNKHTVSFSQRQYILDNLKRFRLSDSKPVATPMNKDVKLSKAHGPKDDEERTAMKKIPYLNAVGALLCLATCTRPDMSYAVGILARFSGDPGPTHWTAVKHLFRYLKGTLNLKLVHGQSKEPESFTTFADADHAGNPDNGKSTGGYFTRLGGAAVGWQSKLQPLVTLSTTEAEYIASVEAGKEIKWMRNILEEFGEGVSAPSTLLFREHCKGASKSSEKTRNSTRVRCEQLGSWAHRPRSYILY
jgi:hypothetical protein